MPESSEKASSNIILCKPMAMPESSEKASSSISSSSSSSSSSDSGSSSRSSSRSCSSEQVIHTDNYKENHRRGRAGPDSPAVTGRRAPDSALLAGPWDPETSQASAEIIHMFGSSTLDGRSDDPVVTQAAGSGAPESASHSGTRDPATSLDFSEQADDGLHNHIFDHARTNVQLHVDRHPPFEVANQLHTPDEACLSDSLYRRDGTTAPANAVDLGDTPSNFDSCTSDFLGPSIGNRPLQSERSQCVQFCQSQSPQIQKL